MRIVRMRIKRFMDIVGCGIGLLLFFPFFVLISVLIKSTSKGPVFFSQARIGEKGKVFRIIKFRTMVVGAEQLGDGLRVKSEGDRRITKVGRLLRVSSLDELPQLVNVFLGHMSLVGPRPPVTYFPYDGYDNYPDWAKKRFDMRPGITGLTQVTVRNSVSWDDRIKMDNQYIDDFTVLLDIRILLKTVSRVIRPQDIYNANLQQKMAGDQEKHTETL